MRRTVRNICPECDAGDPTSVIKECDCQEKAVMPSSGKWTPGPWRAEHSGTGDARVMTHNGWVNKNGTPFNTTIVNRIDWDTAHLIAAAPEMAEVLRQVIEDVRCLFVGTKRDYELFAERMLANSEDAKKILAKAKGHENT